MNPFTRIAKAVLPRHLYTGARETLRALPHIGGRVECPCCGGRFRRFLTAGYRRRPNARCPRCGSMERHRLLWLFLRERTSLLATHGPELRLLHFAPEHCFGRAFEKLDRIDYVSTDIERGKAMLVMDITRIAFADATCDAIICSHVLEHVPDDRAALGELFRVLKPGGWAVIEAPVDGSRESTHEDPSIVTPEDRDRQYGHREHVRLYGRDYAARLERAGFAVTVVRLPEELGPDACARHGLQPGESIHFCTKPV